MRKAQTADVRSNWERNDTSMIGNCMLQKTVKIPRNLNLIAWYVRKLCTVIVDVGIIRQKERKKVGKESRMESILKRLQEIRLAKRTRADGKGVAGETADKNSRFLRGESIFFFVRESEIPKELVHWLFLRLRSGFSAEQPNRCASKMRPSTSRPRATRMYNGADRIFLRPKWRRGKERPVLNCSN